MLLTALTICQMRVPLSIATSDEDSANGKAFVYVGGFATQSMWLFKVQAAQDRTVVLGFPWRENDSNGNRTRRTAVIGTVEQLPTRDLAEVAVNGLRVCINQHWNRQREQSIVVADLVDQYIQTELSDDAWRVTTSDLASEERGLSKEI
jgi:hypothetical protein